MPEKDPSNWMLAWEYLPEPVRASIVAVFVALLRIFYDDKEPRAVRRGLEALLCGGITFAVGSGISVMGLGEGWAMFVGGAVGLLGADKVRELGKRFAKRKADEL
jgi:lambda family phage holin